jgi:hypothetical protein
LKSGSLTSTKHLARAPSVVDITLAAMAMNGRSAFVETKKRRRNGLFVGAADSQGSTILFRISEFVVKTFGAEIGRA